MGAYYDRLKAVSDLPYDEATEENYRAQADAQLAEAKQLAATYKARPGLTGETRTAALAWLDQYTKLLEDHKSTLKIMADHNDAAVAAMKQAKEVFGNLSPELVTPAEKLAYQDAPPLIVGALGSIAGDVYLQKLAEAREKEREAAAKKALDQMNSTVTQEAANITVPVQDIAGPGTGGAGGGGGSASTGASWGNNTGVGGSSAGSTGGYRRTATDVPGGVQALHPAGGGGGGATTPVHGIEPAAPVPAHVGQLHPVRSTLPPGAIVGPHSVVATSPAVPWTPPKTGPGSPGHPITDPAQVPDLPLHTMPVNPHLTPDGPVGGYVPAPVTNVNDPRWSQNYTMPGTIPGASAGGGIGSAGLVTGSMLAGGGTALASKGVFGNLTPAAGGAGVGLAGAGAASRIPGGGILGGQTVAEETAAQRAAAASEATAAEGSMTTAGGILAPGALGGGAGAAGSSEALGAEANGGRYTASLDAAEGELSAASSAETGAGVLSHDALAARGEALAAEGAAAEGAAAESGMGVLPMAGMGGGVSAGGVAAESGAGGSGSGARYGSSLSDAEERLGAAEGEGLVAEEGAQAEGIYGANGAWGGLGESASDAELARATGVGAASEGLAGESVAAQSAAAEGAAAEGAAAESGMGVLPMVGMGGGVSAGGVAAESGAGGSGSGARYGSSLSDAEERLAAADGEGLVADEGAAAEGVYGSSGMWDGIISEATASEGALADATGVSSIAEGAAGEGMGLMPMTGGGVAGRDDQQKAQQVGYEVPRLDDEQAPVNPVSGPGAAAGSSENLRPLVTDDEVDHW